MLEEAFKGAAQNLNSSVLGSVLILVIVAFAITVKLLRQDIKDLQEEVKLERQAHQETRESQLEDIRNLNNVATSLNGLQTAITRMEDRFADGAFNSRRNGRESY